LEPGIEDIALSLEQFSYISQIAASIAVVGSLIYLARQIRQTERNQRAIIQQGRADRASSGAMSIASPEMASVFRKGITADAGLTQEEFDQLLMMCRALLLSGEDSYLQHKAGLLDRRAFDSWVAGARAYMAAPGLRAVWKLTGNQYCEEYRDFVNSNIVHNTPVAHGRDAFAVWRKLVLENGPK
jgi:hypothetical protein